MSKLKEVLVSIGLFVIGILIWGYKMLISSDIPVSISLKQLIGLIITICIYTIFEYFYVKKLRSNLFILNLVFLAILFILWFGNFATAFAYNYHLYDTISDIVGFISITIIIIEFFTYKIKGKMAKV